ncbi:MAG TPA: c-type cytochrome domain-containing protein [Pirellulales bacterium]|nr:c-type cytochrome domain-containing protein [Pirellulales bacterium]
MNAVCKPVACVLAVILLGAAATRAADEKAKPIAIADIKRDSPVNFEKDILPILTKNCVACHNTKKAENLLVLETPQSILKGGDSGPAVVAKQSAESLLLKAAAHLEEPLMPPADNKVGAVALSPDQLGLIKVWIDQGATGEVTHQAAPIKWQPLPSGINPIYAVAMTPDGQYAACGRANQIFVYHLASGKLVTRLTDPELIKSALYQNQGVAHLDLVQSLAFSPDGNLLASGAFREVKLWRKPHDAHRADLAAGAGPVQAIAVSDDGKWAASGEASGAIKLWDLGTLKDPKTLAGHTAGISRMQFLPNSAKLVSGSLDKTIRLWTVADGALAGQVETPAPVDALALVADGTQVAVGAADNVIRLWTLPTDAAGPFVAGAQITGHMGPVRALVASPTDKTQLVSASADGTIRQWNLTNGQQIREIKHGAAVAALAIRGDGQQLASAGADNLIKLWNAADGQTWAAPDKQPIAAMKGDFRAQFKLAQLERALAAITAKVADDKKSVTESEAKIVSTAAGVTASTTAKEAAAKTRSEKTAAVKAPTDAKAAADKAFADATTASKAAIEKAAQAKAAAEKDAQNADLAKANEEAKKEADAADKTAKELEKKAQEAAAVLTKATQEATAAEAANMAAEQAAAAAIVAIKKAVTDVPVAEQVLKDSEAALAKTTADTDAAKQTVAAAEKPLRALAYSADGSLLASAGENNLVRTWTTDTGAPVESFEGHKGAVLAAAFTADGSVLSGATDGSTILWNPSPAWTLERRIGNVDDPATFVDRVIALAFSPDGKLLATGGGEPSRSGELKLFNVADGSLARAIPDAHSDTIFGLDFSPDGLYLASSAADRFVKVFNVAAGTHYRSFEGHTHHVLAVAWKSDGKVLASCGADNVIKIWDFITGDQRRTTAPFGKEITSIHFVAATPKVFVSSGDKTVRLLNTDNGAVERSFAGSNDFMYSTATSADGRIGIAGGQDSVMFLWLIDSGQLLKSFEAPKPAEIKQVAGQPGSG